ncbi:MerR family transcriptional regulator [Vibrio sp. 16]|uniref:MerR family transcriptional regulator n=1 Tax=Vibrio sp. 16 TaxID=391586 RepID=UPI002FF0C1F8
MYKISQLGEKLGLSRTTLLYYEKLGLIKGKRLDNGYRLYSDKDLQRLRLIQKLQAGGLTLKECQACLEEKIEREMLLKRLHQLDQEIAEKQKSRELLAALVGEAPMTEWHENLDDVAPDAHVEWLKNQGFDDKQIQRLRWLSKDMNQHDQYMDDFMRVFEPLSRWGPGSDEDTARAASLLPASHMELLEIGCGKGLSTEWLAKHLTCHVIAVDNEPSALEALTTRAIEKGFNDTITTVCANMASLPFQGQSFDAIWAEGCAYLMGFDQALAAWRPLLKSEGVLVISDAVWSTKQPDAMVKEFWQREYPQMVSAEQRVAEAKFAGYDVVDTFALSEQAWDNYYHPLAKRVAELRESLADSSVLNDLEHEILVSKARKGQVDYQMFILKPRSV